jgi:hypothetical protein
MIRAAFDDSITLTMLFSSTDLVSNMHGASPPYFRRHTSSRSLRFQVDSTGVSGGCQDMYTVIPNSSFTLQNPANCTNVTLPTNSLDVDASVVNGAFAQYGWPAQVRV